MADPASSSAAQTKPLSLEAPKLSRALHVWRTRALYALLAVIAVAGLPAYLAPVVIAYRAGHLTPLLWAYLGIYVAFVALGLAPALPDRARAFALLVLGYANGGASLARLGLIGSGRLYLLALPLVATLLLGARAGYVTAGLSLLIYVGFAALAGTGRLAGLLTTQGDPVALPAWIEAGAALAVFLLALAVLIERFYALLVRTLISQQRASNELAATARTLQEREERLTRQNVTLAALHETAIGVAGARDVGGLLRDLVERAVALVGGAYGWLYLVDRERDMLEAVVGTGFFRRYVGVRLARGEGLAGRIWAAGRAELVENYRTWEGRSPHFQGHPIGPALGVPMFHENQVVGVIGLTRAAYARPFGQDDLDAMGRLAELAAIALANARLNTSLEQELAARVAAQTALQAAYQDLERRVQERTRELATLNAVAVAASGSLELDDVMREALEKTLEATGMDIGLAYRLEPISEVTAGWHLGVAAQRGLPDDVLDQVQRALPLQGTVLAQAAAVRRPVLWRVADYPGPELRAALVRAGISQGVSVPLLAKGQLIGGLALATRTERAVTEDELALLAGIGAQIGVAADNARLYAAERDRREEAERSRRVADGMREIFTALNSRQSPAETLDFIVHHACRMVGCDGAAIWRLEEAAGPLVIQAACGLEPAVRGAVTLPLNDSITGQAIVEGRAMLVPDLAADLAARRGPQSVYLDAPVFGRFVEQYRAMLAAPLYVQGQPYGAIALYYRSPRPFDEQEVQQARSLADQAALAIESARLREQAGQVAALEERSRLARELHDSVTQSLYSASLYAEAAARRLETGHIVEAAEHVAALRETTRDALREMRLLIFELRPPDLEKNGLAAALQGRLQAVEARGGIAVRFSVEGEERLALAVQQELYQITREALNNALKHAHSGRITVRLHYGTETTLLEVQDDGVGFDPVSASGLGGMGLHTMRERAERIGARLEIDSSAGHGTLVRVAVTA